VSEDKAIALNKKLYSLPPVFNPKINAETVGNIEICPPKQKEEVLTHIMYNHLSV
jgi:hypothetical protein